MKANIRTLMKASLIFVFILLIFGQVFSAGVQTTFTKVGNEVTVTMKPSSTISGQTFSGLIVPFRFLNSDNLSFAVTYSNPAISTVMAGVVDDDPNYVGVYSLISFGFVGGLSTNTFTGGNEYTLFKFTVTGGNQFSTIGLVFDQTNEYVAPWYKFNTDLTDYTNPFYGSLAIADYSINGENWLYRTSQISLGKNWLTTGTTDWNTPTNWDEGSVPLSADNVWIPAGGVQPIIVTAAVCNKLDLSASATLNVSSTGSLTVNGDLSVASDNSFVVQSGGSVITHAAVPSGNKVKVQRAIGSTNWANNNDGWHLLSSPVAAQSISGTFTPSDVAPNRYDFYSWDEPTQFWLNKKAGGMPTFLVGKGYLVSYETGVTHDFVGTLNSADKAVTLTKNGTGGSYGYNLLGNPFPSALTWATGWTLTNIGPAATYVWSNTMQDYDLISVGEAIPAENGFMVYTSVASQSLTIPEAARVHDGTAWYKAATPQIKLIAHDLNNGSSKASLVRFDPNATAGFDLAYDAYNLSGFAPKFYSAANGEKFGLNTLPEAKDGLVIPFGFEKNGSTNFSIELSESLDGVVLALRDKKTNTTVNLSKNPVYSFTSSVGDDANRFELLFGSQLGVNDSKALASASAYSVDNRIVINNVNGDTQMDIINVQGQLLKKYDFFSNGSHEVSVNLPTGVYMVRLSNGGELRTMKVFVK